MDRSPGFGSNATNYGALLRLALAMVAVLNTLTLLATLTRQLIMQKARRHTL